MRDEKGRFIKGSISWLKGTKGLVKPNSGTFKKGNKAWWQKEGKKLINNGNSRFKKGVPKNPETERKRLENMLHDENHPRWKDNKVGYTALHDWVKRRLGFPNHCQECQTEEKRVYHWANISGNYKRNLSDWMRLCVPCHKRFDLDRKKILFAKLNQI